MIKSSIVVFIDSTIKTKILVLESFSNPQTLLDRIDNIDKGNIVLEKNNFGWMPKLSASLRVPCQFR
jgi:hypothetical protein